MEIDSIIEPSRIKHTLKKQQRQLLIQNILLNKQIMFGGTIILLLALLTFIGPLVVPYDPYQMEVTERLQGPNAAHLLGTDEFGRDLLTRIVYGGKITLGVGFAVAFISSLLGLIIGLYASYYRGLDQVLMRTCDGLMAIPAILFAIALMAALGPSTLNVIIALSVVFTPYIARVIRSTAIVIREQTYIEAVRAQGASNLRIIWRHMMPNTISPLVVQATFIFADAIITEAALSFLGAGVPSPEPSWGSILQDGKVVIFNAWWMTVFPGITIISAVLGLNLLGDGLRDLMDPHTKQTKK
ncbi:ABC transporter permease [Brevibacillus marinus]|uniref:ABC transporter permease n=1 Tax=Brevibacillus marinus TaxID=2496837 RepID=UPI001F49B1EF|nr:ABC transporter permease [Brevibacillus marinus]